MSFLFFFGRQKSEKFNDLASKLNSSASSPFQENLVSSLQVYKI